MRRVILVLGLLAVASQVWVPGASAAKPCGKATVKVNGVGVKARVAVLDVSCEQGLELTVGFYEALAEGARPDRSAHYHYHSYRCITGLGASELECKHRSSWVFASTRPEDHPAQWHKPERHEHRSYWHHCAPPRAVFSSDMLAHRVGCGKARALIRRVLVKSQTAQSAHVHALGFTCGLRPYASRAINCRKGGKRVLSPLAA